MRGLDRALRGYGLVMQAPSQASDRTDLLAQRGRISVVVITRDRAPELLRSLERLDALPERPEVVVVDNGSRDGTAERVRERFPRVRVLRCDEDLGAAGRTLGVQAVTTPYVAFCDDDSWWAPGSLARAVALLDGHADVALVAARVLVGDDERLDPACEAMAASPLRGRPGLPGRRVLGFIACGAIVRRSSFLQVGGFDPRLGVGAEEQLLAADLASLGWALVYCPQLVAHHHPSATRDRFARDAVVVRNDLWFSWLRRRGPAALRATVTAAVAAVRQPVARAGLLRAVRGSPTVLASRRPVPQELEADLTLLDAAAG
jgi:GT2 family glycosyltransferase